MRNREERNNSKRRMGESRDLMKERIWGGMVGMSPGFNQMGFFVYNPYNCDDFNKRCR